MSTWPSGAGPDGPRLAGRLAGFVLSVVGEEVVDHAVEQGDELVQLVRRPLRQGGLAAELAANPIGLSGSIAGSIGLVIAFRAAQGVFGAMLQPTALALLRKNFPAGKLNAAIGIWGAVIGASTAAGPIVGGLLVQHVGWEACFYVNIPVGLIALAVSLLVLRETDPSPAARSTRDQQHPGPARQPDHPHQPRHVHRRDA